MNKNEVIENLKNHLGEISSIIDNIEQTQQTNEKDIKLITLYSDNLVCYTKLLNIKQEK